MDTRIVEALNRWFSANSVRADAARTLAIVPLLVIMGLVALAWLADWGREPERRAVLAIGVLGALAALVANVALGHVFYRARPFLTLPVHALLPHAADSSLYADHLAVAGALTAALFVSRRTLGSIALALTGILGVARVGAGVHYPSDAVVGAVAGAALFAVFLPLRHGVARVINVVATGEAAVLRRERRESTFLLRHGPIVSVGILVVAVALGYGVRALQDQGKITAERRAEQMLRPVQVRTPPATYPGVAIATIAGGRYRATHAVVEGDVTQVTRELDGDFHIRIESGGAFLVAEIIPEFPIAPPHVGQTVAAWGIVRHDGLHNWWELHPLIGWAAGLTVQPGSPGPGTGD